jgi:hypothetical protein
MPPQIVGQKVSRVKIVDDDPAAREAMAYTVNDAAFQALPDDGPLPSLPDFVHAAKSSVDAVVCDHRIRGSYATFTGAEAVAGLYGEKCPAVLCTRWSTADIDAMRQYIRYIPSLIPSDDVSPESLVEGISHCIQEFRDNPVPGRKPWRTLIRVESVDTELLPALFYVAVSGWDSKEIIRLPLDLIPKDQRSLIKPDYRFFAQVNKGAERPETLFFSDFEFPSKG